MFSSSFIATNAFSILAFSIVSLGLGAVNARAQNSTGASTASTSSSSSAPRETSSSDYKLLLGLKSYNNSGRVRDLESSTGLRAKSKNEFYIGTQHKSGWGAYLNGVANVASYGEVAKNGSSQGDASIVIMHPSFYDNGSVKHSGYFKIYHPTSEFSRTHAINQYSYNFISSAKDVGAGVSLTNVFVPRYFNDGSRKATNTQYYFEDRTILTKNVNNWMRAGVAQWTQYELHFASSPGFTVEVYPFADFVVAKNTFVSPRVYFPLYARGAVYDGPKVASTQEVKMEVYLQTSL